MANTKADIFNRVDAQNWGATTNLDGVGSAAWGNAAGTRIDKGVGVIPYGGDKRPYGPTLAGPSATGEQLVKVLLTSSLAQAIIVQSVSGGGYVGVIVATTGLQLMSAANYAVLNQGGAFAKTLVVNRWYWVRFTVTSAGGNTTLAARIWQDLMPEPRGAQVTTTLAKTFTAGSHGVYGYWPVTINAPGTETRVGIYAFAPSGATTPINNLIVRGLNAFGAWQSPWGGANTFCSDAQIAYYATTGLHVMRTPMLWEALQPTKGGALDAGYLAQLDSYLASCKKYGMLASPTFIRISYGSSQIDSTAFAAMYKLLVQHELSAGVPDAIWAWDVCNEPWEDPNWQTGSCQAIINAIRSADPQRPILCMAAQENTMSYDGTGVTAIPPIYTDTANNLIYCIHIYFDANDYGQYTNSYDTDAANGVTPAIGIQRAVAAVAWAQANNKRMMVSEYGIPGVWNGQTYDGRWGRVLDTFLHYLDTQGVWGNCWEVGPFGDAVSVEPINGVASPVMPILIAHGVRNNLP